MARPLRITFEGAFYHVTARGNERKNIFLSRKDYEKFLSYLIEAIHKYGILLHAYVLMANHYHLIVETPKANLSPFMHVLNSAYTTYFNLKRGRVGHLFQGRYKAILVDADSYLLELSRYIHLNPVRARLVTGPVDYPWTSYRSFIDQKGENSLVDTGETLSYFSKRRDRGIRAYREFVEGDGGKEENSFAKMEAGILLGNGAFKRKVLRLIESKKVDEEVVQAKRLRKRISIDGVIKVCQMYYGKRRRSLVERAKGNEGRQEAIYLAKIMTGEKGKEIGRYFGIKGPAVSDAIKRIGGRLDRERGLRERIEFLKGRIVPEF